MRPEQRYQDILTVLDSSIAALVGYVYGMDLGHRKVLLKACRIQGPFSKSSRLYTRNAETLEDATFAPLKCTKEYTMMTTHTLMTCWQIIQHYSEYFADPICCGYISMILRYFPYLDYASAQEELKKGVDKELRASQGGGKTAPYLDYRTNFYVDRYHPYRPGFAPDWSIGNRLRGAARRLSKGLLVPRLGNKNIPLPPDYETTYMPYETVLDGSPIRTLRQVERVYYKTGVELHGRTKMKTVWRGNDLKPRVYYSRGASLHRASTYIQQIFNAFVDALENTHRHLRHNTSVLHPGRDDILAIYDYSSFTSVLSEVTRFTSVLAEEFMDFTVNILDPHHGPLEVPIGIILHEYNEACNRNPQFDASEVMQVEEAVLNHNAGMLGVPGNISSCTLLHGIHLAILVLSVMKNKVVGDDAIYFASKDRDAMIREAIQDIGDVVVDKMEVWENSDDIEERIDQRYDYKKRPLNRVENVILTGELVDFPAISLLGIINPFHRQNDDTDEDRESKATSRYCRFNDTLSHMSVTDLAQHLIHVVSTTAYRMLGWSQFGGWTKHRLAYPPIACAGIRYSEWIQHFSDTVFLRLPKVYYSEKRIPDTFDVGQDFYQRSTAMLSYFTNIGVLEDATEFELVSCRDLVDYYGVVSQRALDNNVVRKYVIVDSLPHWFEDYFVSLEGSTIGDV